MPQEDILDLLVRDHKRIRERLNAAIDASTAAERTKARQALEAELTLHMLAEQHVLNPSLHNANHNGIEGDGLADAHQHIGRLLGDLMHADAAAPDFHDAAVRLRAVVVPHLDHEEVDLYPAARRVLNKKQRLFLRDAAASLKAELLTLGTMRPLNPLKAALRMPGVQRPLTAAPQPFPNSVQE